MDDQEKYEDLDNIEATLNVLIEETLNEYYIDQFKNIITEIQEEKEELEKNLRKERDLENYQFNNDYEKSKI